MKRAFTLIELIFVIVIIGVLGGLGFSSLKTDYANKDGQFLLLKIKEARYKAIGYEGHKSESCITLDKNTTNTAEKNNPKVKNPYKIRSNISLSLPSANNKLCFDSFGRPHDGDAYDINGIKLNNFIKNFIKINVTNGGDTCTIGVYPLSGYAIITCQ